MTLIPDWAPNLHPLLVHFPIAWLIGAVVADLCGLIVPRATWAGRVTLVLYPAGALSALATYLTGRQAAASVLLPGMAHPIVADHWNWALATTTCFLLIAAIRLALGRQPQVSRRSHAVIVAAGFLGLFLLVQTAERGARLVFQEGVGVVAPARRN
jgi:uncharacterized membrane protein